MLTANDILQRYDHAKGARSWFEQVWDEIFQCFLPRRMGLYDTRDTQGKDRSIKIYDGTPGASLMRLAAVLNSTLTNQATNWFLLETDDAELNEMPEVKEWLDNDRDAVRKGLENSNFYEQIFEFYVDLCGPATACLYAEESKDTAKDLYFTTRHLREIVIQEDDQGQVNAVYMLREMTAWQIMDRWRNARISGNIPTSVRQAMDTNKPNTVFEVLHAVFPNDEFDERIELTPRRFRYASVWIFKQDKSEIDRSGYHEMPYITAFWSKASAEQYGRGPGWDALSDVKSLYSMKKSMLRAGEKAVDPPIMMPHSTTTYPASLRPGGMTYFDAQARHPPFPLQIGQSFPIGREMIQDERNQVRDWFYITQLHLIDSKEMTAEEVRARMAENAKILGPTFGRLNNFLERLFDRVLGILGRKGKLGQVPEVVRRKAQQSGTQLKIKFVSPIVKSAALAEVQGIVHSASTAIQWAVEGQVVEVLDNFDWDFGIRKVADLDGAPPEFLRDKKKVEAIRKQRRMQQEMMSRLEALEKRAGIAGDLAGAQAQTLDNQQRRSAGAITQ